MTFSINSCAPRAIAAFLVAVAVAIPAAAQDLKWGSKAPALSIEEWMKGKEVKAFQPGEIYVVEFWATWCPPCLRSIPHLTEVQKKYAGSKLTVIGVASSERPKTVDAQRTGLTKFIEGKGETMAYTIGFDSDKSMGDSWMEAAGQGGIPTCFIVDGTGTLAWIGSPFEMDEPLAQIVSGKWDVKAELAKAEAKAKAEAELEAKLEPFVTDASKAAEEKDWDGAIKALDEAMAQIGDEAVKRLAWFKYNMHVEKADFVGAIAFVDKHLKGALKEEDELLNALAQSMIDPQQAGRYTSKDYEFALRCSARASELNKGKSEEPRMLDVQAAVHFTKGDFAKAVEVQTRVVELTKGKDGAAEYAEKLETYKKAAIKG